MEEKDQAKQVARGNMPGGQPKFQWLATRLIRIDHEYQREQISERTIKEIKNDFNWAAFGALAVTRRADGMFYVFDGQHRLMAAKDMGYVSVPCAVYASSGAVFEAKMFMAVNSGRVAVKAMDKYRAKLKSGDSESMSIESMLSELGLRIVNHSGSVDGVNFIGHIQRVHKTDPKRCALAMEISQRICGSDPIHHYIFLGAATLLLHGLPLSENVDKIIQAGGRPAAIAAINRAAALANIGSHTGRQCAQGLLDIINHKRHKKLRLPECV